MEIALLFLAAHWGLVAWLPLPLILVWLFMDSARPLHPWPALRAHGAWRATLGAVHRHTVVPAPGVSPGWLSAAPGAPGRKPRLWVVYPHGQLALSALLTFAVDGAAGGGHGWAHAGGSGGAHVRLAVHAFLVRMPWTRRVAAWLGLVGDDLATLRHQLLEHRRDVAVVAEGVDAQGIDGAAAPVRPAAGYLRLLASLGATLGTPAAPFDVVPVLALGERDACTVLGHGPGRLHALAAAALRPVQAWTRRAWGYPFPSPYAWPAWGRPLARLTTVVGPPLAAPWRDAGAAPGPDVWAAWLGGALQERYAAAAAGTAPARRNNDAWGT